MELSQNRINGRAMDMSRIDEVVEAGATEVWELVNAHTRPHNLHIHDARLQIVSERGVPVPAAQRAWKDTVYVAPKTTSRVVVWFGAHADPGTPYMYHCHLLYHEDQSMMGQFVVVRPGQRAPERIAAPMGAAHGAGGHHG